MQGIPGLRSVLAQQCWRFFYFDASQLVSWAHVVLKDRRVTRHGETTNIRGKNLFDYVTSVEHFVILPDFWVFVAKSEKNEAGESVTSFFVIFANLI